jgi:parallel beta helix pectate lyase-like protein
MNRVKRVLGVVAVVCLLAVLVAPPTQTSTPANVNHTTHGRISQDEIWRDEIRIIGDIFVESGVTLTIEPGTRVLIAANSDTSNLHKGELDMRQGLNTTDEDHSGVFLGEPWRDEGNHIYIDVDGMLQAVGTAEKMITITSDSPNPGRYDWTGMYFESGILSYAIVEYYRHLGSGDGTIISHCVLRHVGECGVGTGHGQSATIEYNTIYDTGHELIDTHPPCKSVIRGNHLGPNPSLVNQGGYEAGGCGIVLDATSPEIVGNTIEGCVIGILFLTPPVIPYDTFIPQLCADNDFIDNRHDFREHNANKRTCPAAGRDEEESSQEDGKRPRD